MESYNNTTMKNNSLELLNMREKGSPTYPVIDICYTSR